MKNNFFKATIALIFLCLTTQLNAQQDWQWARKQSSTGNDYAQDVYADSWGNTYVTGFFNNTVTIGTFTLASSGPQDIYVAKYDVSGNALWATRAGSNDYDTPTEITADIAGNTYVAGYFSDTTIIGTDTLISGGQADVFIFKIDPAGTILWAKKGGSPNWDQPSSIQCDNSGNCWLTGSFSGTANFSGTTLTSYNINDDYFILKYTPSGNVAMAISDGAFGDDFVNDLVLDNNGNFYVTGSYFSTFILGSDTLTMVGPGGSDAFIAKYNSTGIPQWATKGGGANNFDAGNSISLDATGNIYVAGTFSSTSYFGQDTVVSAGGTDFFISKLDGNGTFLWTFDEGTSSTLEYFNKHISDINGNLYLIGSFYSSTTLSGITLTGNGGSETMYIAKYDADGNIQWAKKNAGVGSNRAYGVSADYYGNVFVAGYFSNTATFGTNSIVTSGSNDGYLVRLGCSYNVNSSVNSTAVLCYGDSTGTATVSASGGNGSYNYAWLYTNPQQDSATATGLTAGDYVVFVADTFGCSVADTVTITQPQPLIVNATVSGASCFNSCDGSATAGFSGGTGAISYSWMPGGQTTPSITNSCAGNYYVCISDANGCVACDTVIITQPQQLQLSATATDVSCSSCCDGTLNSSVTGGAGAYTYTWSGGATTPSVSNACAGSYTICVTDSNSCSICDSVTVNITTGIIPNVHSAGVTVFPNPTAAGATVMLPEDLGFSACNIAIYDVTGKRILVRRFTHSSMFIEKDILQTGIYIYEISEHNKKFASGKLIIY